MLDRLDGLDDAGKNQCRLWREVWFDRCYRCSCCCCAAYHAMIACAVAPHRQMKQTFQKFVLHFTTSSTHSWTPARFETPPERCDPLSRGSLALGRGWSTCTAVMQNAVTFCILRPKSATLWNPAPAENTEMISHWAKVAVGRICYRAPMGFFKP